jgi:ubiquinone/menaquinone biosynthesis C-methylase UbiE
MNNKKENYEYSAKYSYQDGSSVEEYEKERFSGPLGKYRYTREQKAVSFLVECLPENITIVDCPCGNGRWWPILSRKAKKIIAFDVSPGMLAYATEQAKLFDTLIEVKEGNAESLLLKNDSVDYVFSHALTKHLPIPVQYRVLAEFSRISKKGVICSFGVFNHITYEIWRHRHISESYPIMIEELEWMANAAGLRIELMRKCTTPIGVEKTILFVKE